MHRRDRAYCAEFSLSMSLRWLVDGSDVFLFSFVSAVAGAAHSRDACASCVRAVFAGALIFGAARTRGGCATCVRDVAACAAIAGISRTRGACTSRMYVLLVLVLQ